VIGEKHVVRSVTLLALVLALLSSWHSGGHVWRALRSERLTYDGLSPTEQQHAFITAMTLPPDAFDFYRPFVGKGDRVYYQVSPSGLSSFFTLEQAIEAAGRFYLLPSVQTGDLDQATVVVSFAADPGLLHRHFITQQREGLQENFVSRIR
jgi:hypothetical protein